MIDGEAPRGSAKALGGTGDRSGRAVAPAFGEGGRGYVAGSCGLGGGRGAREVVVRLEGLGERGRLGVPITDGVSLPKEKLVPPPNEVRKRAEAGAGEDGRLEDP